MANIKSTLSTIAGIMAVISAAILGAQTQGLILPNWLLVTAGILGALSIAIIGFLTGKLPNGTAKTSDQIESANNGK